MAFIIFMNIEILYKLKNIKFLLSHISSVFEFQPA